MKKFLQSASVASALTILSLVAATGPVSASAVHASKTSHVTGKSQKLRVFEHLVNEKNVNIFPKETPRGNIIVFDDPVFDSTDQKRIGHASGSCFYTTNVLQECSWSLILPKGNISIEGPQVDNLDTINAVTGGTGIYKLARGQAKIHVFEKHGFVDFRYDIQLVK